MEDSLCSSSNRCGMQSGVPLSTGQAHKMRHRARLKPVQGLAKGRPQPAGSSWEAEFAKYSEPDRLKRVSEHLELTWNVAKVSTDHCKNSGIGRQDIGMWQHACTDRSCQLLWTQNAQPQECAACAGSGRQPCIWCNETGALQPVMPA